MSSGTTGTFTVKRGLADMLRGGVIMDVVNAEQAKIAEDAGAVSVMALERVPADIRRDGGVARMSDPVLIEGIIDTVTIPVMAKARIGHFAEAQVLQALGVDFVDESEVLTPAARYSRFSPTQRRNVRSPPKRVPSVMPMHETPLSPRFTCASSCAITPSSSSSFISERIPSVAATAACWGFRPVANAFGESPGST